VKSNLGLDEAPSWVVLSECNVDHWPPAGIETVLNRAKTFAYGHLPPRLFTHIKTKLRAVVSAGKLRQVHR